MLDAVSIKTQHGIQLRSHNNRLKVDRHPEVILDESPDHFLNAPAKTSEHIETKSSTETLHRTSEHEPTPVTATKFGVSGSKIWKLLILTSCRLGAQPLRTTYVAPDRASSEAGTCEAYR